MAKVAGVAFCDVVNRVGIGGGNTGCGVGGVADIAGSCGCGPCACACYCIVWKAPVVAGDTTAGIVIACCRVLDVSAYVGTAVCDDIGTPVVLGVTGFTAACCVVAVVTASVFSECSV